MLNRIYNWLLTKRIINIFILPDVYIECEATNVDWIKTLILLIAVITLCIWLV